MEKIPLQVRPGTGTGTRFTSSTKSQNVSKDGSMKQAWESQLDRTIRDPTPSKMAMMEQSWDACVVLRALLDLESAEPPLAPRPPGALNLKWKISTRDFESHERS